MINKINLEPDLMNNENKLNPAVQLERQHYRNGSNKSTTSQYSLDTVQGHCFKKKITVRTRKLWNRKKTLKDWSYDFKLSNEHETHQLCSVNRLITLKWFYYLLVKLPCDSIKYIWFCFNVVFLFQFSGSQCMLN